VVTNRDEWVYGESEKEVGQKVRYLIDAYNADVERIGHVAKGTNVGALVDTTNQMDSGGKKEDLERAVRYTFESKRIVPAAYRPFMSRLLYFSPQLNEMPNLMPQYFGSDGRAANVAIVFTDPTSQKPFMVAALSKCPDMHFVGAAAGSLVLPLQRFERDATRINNITDWALDQFKKQYQPGRAKPKRAITKDAIFHYVYGVLHDPVYREKYALNLKREFPRIPFYSDFWQWADWGKAFDGSAHRL